MKLTSKTLLTGLSATLCVVITLASVARAGGGDGDSPYNMPRSFYGGGSEGGGEQGGGEDDASTNSEQQKAVLGPTRENSRGPKSTDTTATTAGVEKKKDVNAKFATLPVTVLPGGSFAVAPMLDVHAATVQVNGAMLKVPSPAQSVFSESPIAAGPLALQVGAGQSTVAKPLPLGFRAQGSFALNAGKAQVVLALPATTPTAFATVSLGTVGADGVFHPETTTVVTVQSTGFDVSALVAQWSNVESAVGKTVQVELASSGVGAVATARFAAGVAKPTLHVNTQP